jgi:hypothetical protein
MRIRGAEQRHVGGSVDLPVAPHPVSSISAPPRCSVLRPLWRSSGDGHLSLNGQEKGLTDSVFAIADGVGTKDVTELNGRRIV